MEPIQHILLLTDITEDVDLSIAWALHLARQEDARVTLLHALTHTEADAWSPLRLSPEQAVLRQDPEEVVESLMKTMLAHHDTDGLAVEMDTVRGEAVVPAILHYVDAMGVDLIVMGTHARRGFRRFFRGSVAESVVRGASCPVFVVPTNAPNPAAHPLRRILVPVDFTVTGEPAFHIAERWAREHDAALIVQHVVEGVAPAELFGTEYAPVPSMTIDMINQAREALQRRVTTAMADGVPVVEQRLDEGEPVPSIVETARDVDASLIVLGTHGRAGLDRLLMGSIAEHVLRKAGCPVLIVRSPSGLSAN